MLLYRFARIGLELLSYISLRKAQLAADLGNGKIGIEVVFNVVIELFVFSEYFNIPVDLHCAGIYYFYYKRADKILKQQRGLDVFVVKHIMHRLYLRAAYWKSYNFTHAGKKIVLRQDRSGEMYKKLFQMLVTPAAVPVICRDDIDIARLHYYIFFFVKQHTTPVKHDIYAVEVVAIVIEPPFRADCGVVDMRCLYIDIIKQVCKLLEIMVHSHPPPSGFYLIIDHIKTKIKKNYMF